MTLILLSGVVLGITFVLSAILDRDQGAITQLYSKHLIAKVFHFWNLPVTSVVDPDLGSGIEKKSGSRTNIPDYISAESLKTVFMVKILIFFDRIRDPEFFEPGSGMAKF